MKGLILQIMKEKQEKNDKGKKEENKLSKSKNNKQLSQLYRAGLRGYSLASPIADPKFEK